MVGLLLFSKDGPGTPVFKILVRALIVLVRVLILVKLTFWTAISAHQVIISVSVWYGKYTTHWLKT